MAVLKFNYRVFRPRTLSSIAIALRSFSSCSSSSSVNSGIDLKQSTWLDHDQKGLPLSRKPSDRNVQWVFLGCPGVGKGTYASRLSNLLGVPHIATGDLVREELSSSGSQLADIVNQGKLVSDEIIINLLSKRLEASAAKGETGFILDGFPRTIRQAEILEGVTDIDLVINLKLREEALLAKCLGRRICSECRGNYNVASIDIKGEDGNPDLYMAPLLPPPHCTSKLITRSDDTEEVVKNRLRIYNEMGEDGDPDLYMAPLLPPPHCASKLITRSDDTEEVVKNRLRIYNEMSQPLEEFYRSRGKLLEFDLPGGIPESWPKLLQALNLEDHDEQFAAA